MPSFAVPMKPLADATFVGQFRQLAVDWKQPQGEDAKMYRDAFKPSEHLGVPEPGCYFWAVSTNEYHVRQCKSLGKDFKEFTHTMLDGIQSAVDLWRAKAQFQNLTINAMIVNGSPGCLFAPPIAPDIKMLSYPSATSYRKTWRDAVADGVSECWKAWADQVTIPGMAAYPAFAAFPAPVTPPMPNTPFPLVSCTSAGMTKMTPSALKQAMENHFPGGGSEGQFSSVAHAIGTALSAAFMAWLPTQMVNNVMGMGPVPTYAPPVMPVGPVVMGMTIPQPGHLAA
ncbi:MAG: hypothetical protein VX223_06165 [Myxococcota bacterium]|nr:hypothetical protein [Myxococcota bacterium]